MRVEVDGPMSGWQIGALVFGILGWLWLAIFMILMVRAAQTEDKIRKLNEGWHQQRLDRGSDQDI